MRIRVDCPHCKHDNDCVFTKPVIRKAKTYAFKTKCDLCDATITIRVVIAAICTECSGWKS